MVGFCRLIGIMPSECFLSFAQYLPLLQTEAEVAQSDARLRELEAQLRALFLSHKIDSPASSFV